MLAEAIIAAGGRACAIQADVAREENIIRLFETAERELGPIKALVNNAAITGGFSRVDSVSARTLEQVMAVNVTGAFLCAREAVRRMSSRHGGSGGAIVNISSRAARIGSAGEWVHYAASKGAIDSFTIGLAREVATEGIRVNAVAPGADRHATACRQRRARSADSAGVKPFPSIDYAVDDYCRLIDEVHMGNVHGLVAMALLVSLVTPCVMGPTMPARHRPRAMPRSSATSTWRSAATPMRSGSIPHDAAACNNRGYARLWKGDTLGAIADYDEALRLDPNYAKSPFCGMPTRRRASRQGRRRLHRGHPPDAKYARSYCSRGATAKAPAVFTDGPPRRTQETGDIHGEVFFVAPDGDDNNPGTSSGLSPRSTRPIRGFGRATPSTFVPAPIRP